MLLMSACSVKTPDGTGVVKNGDYCYRGELSGGKYNGYGVLTFKDSIVYSGQWKDGKRDGLGQTTDSLGRTVTSRLACQRHQKRLGRHLHRRV